MNISNENFLKYLSQIKEISKDDVELQSLAKKNLQILAKNYDEFIKQVNKNGYNPKNPDIGIIEVRFFTLMKIISEKLGLPVDKYDKQIENIEKRVMGEENYKRFFK